jgi:hypothetical protein
MVVVVGEVVVVVEPTYSEAKTAVVSINRHLATFGGSHHCKAVVQPNCVAWHLCFGEIPFTNSVFSELSFLLLTSNTQKQTTLPAVSANPRRRMRTQCDRAFASPAIPSGGTINVMRGGDAAMLIQQKDPFFNDTVAEVGARFPYALPAVEAKGRFSTSHSRVDFRGRQWPMYSNQNKWFDIICV